MKKLTLIVAALFIAGASFAHDGDKKACCKKGEKETKACCKKGEGKKECSKEAHAEKEMEQKEPAKKA
jgi:hypothetical protein